MARRWRNDLGENWRLAAWLWSVDWHAELTPFPIKGRWLSAAAPLGCWEPASMSATPKRTRSFSRRYWNEERSSASSRWARIRLPKISQFGTGLWLGCRSGWLWSREHNIAAR